MGLLDPDILEAGKDLSPALTGIGVAIGLFLWLFGAWTHRFWIVLAFTLGAGVYGLLYGPEHGMQPIVAGLLLAVAAGALGLALMRVLAFVTGGLGVYLAVRALAPGVDEPLLCILIGGLVSVLLFRLWITSISSVAGTLLLAYFSLWLIDKVGSAGLIAVAGNNLPLCNWGLSAFAVVGVIVQFMLHRWYVRKKKAKEEQAALAEQHRLLEEEERLHYQPPPPPPPPRLPPSRRKWWGGRAA
jgi:hypothetical protein